MIEQAIFDFSKVVDLDSSYVNVWFYKLFVTIS